MSRVLLDTNVASYLMKGTAEAERYRRHVERQRIALTLISVAEMRYGGLKADWGEERRLQLERFIAGCTLIPGNAEIALTAAAIMNHRKRIGRRMEWPDAWVAATAIAHGLPLITHDADFYGIDGLEVVTELRQLRESEPQREPGWTQGNAAEWLVAYLSALRSAHMTA
jgi:predicted nucleic acid-binding protein